ncbi:hypothetical protein HYPBUDRAFT_152116 [Hyphopichia burtonii NRRL Y-1933]|uniref:Uncharacterized protein n=1 Tax=Hyphopichia burtonii NRRL Y-1933 TaxID=984485 RepID=A0A1E4RND6_9ASCO|nr:hypothetical protein HYPBUDRAFT_152116 [Hyphopichia burtonii NRRL Y-1933]ODV68794.1 hypothetical protein HYPBUDRAFT_152116 [Hyphopichia burtonii NRRL Y-1933]
MLTPPSTNAAGSASTDVDNQLDELRRLLDENKEILNKKGTNMNIMSTRIDRIVNSDKETGDLLREIHGQLELMLEEYEGTVPRQNNEVFPSSYQPQELKEKVESSPQENLVGVRDDLDQASGKMSPQITQDFQSILESVKQLANSLPMTSTNVNNLNELISLIDLGISAFK